MASTGYFSGKKPKPAGTRKEDGDHFANFIDAIRQRKPEILNAPNRRRPPLHARWPTWPIFPTVLGRTSHLDPNTETFPGDKEANSHLGRKYRSPYVVPEKV